MNILWILLAKGGGVMIIILIASILALTIIIERAIYLFQYSKSSVPFLLVIKEKLRGIPSATRVEEAIQLCDNYSSPLSPLVKVVIKNRKDSREDIEKKVASESQKIIPRLERWLTSLSTIASISPLLGLLGTVIGMIRSFTVIARGDVASEALASGISQALYTTAFGLLVAIPCLVFYNFFSRKADQIINQMEIYSSELISYIKEQQ